MELRVEGLVAGYGAADAPAVAGVDLTVPAGTVVAIVGPNGCGKSTLLRAIGRLHRPRAGRVLVGGDDVWGLRPRDAAHRIALLPQAPQPPEGVTALALVGYGRHPHQGLFRQWSPADEAAVAHALRVTGVTPFAGRRIDRLSGGQAQRAWVAMTVAQEAPVMLLDEPTSALDLGHQVEVLELLRSLGRAGRTVVMVLHDLASAARYADVLVAMRDGRIVATGPPREVVDAALVRRLYDVDAEVLQAADGSPVVVPRPGAQPAGSAGAGGRDAGAAGASPPVAAEAGAGGRIAAEAGPT
ncbi:ABC transporter ATP-binding protein [Patulibacter sp. SYSU D01012]|uniref:ABC transporter ATP-binding protein n=1 Tax=Patulibacter sp. SYSU D01012 TaxID=2817381 RepID=UPI001B30D63B|nr:ABC transporter ATP-binding protein [Patulibacter sp. SYSU D01012]